MPFLMVNLDDAADCRRGLEQLRRVVRGGEASKPCGDGPRSGGGKVAKADRRPPEGANPDGVPLRQKLARIQQRGVWRFLVGIARLDDQPRSLAELDEALGLPPNKMRSTKAILAKIENRQGIKFLVPADAANDDESGNARYRMPPRMRNVILRLAE